MQIQLLMNVPIYSSDGHLLRSEPEEHILANRQQFALTCNRRGHVKRATLKPPAVSFDQRPTSSVGNAFLQTLPTGATYALHGVRGSGGRDVVGEPHGKYSRREMVGC
jgi:hypothetical protein